MRVCMYVYMCVCVYVSSQARVINISWVSGRCAWGGGGAHARLYAIYTSHPPQFEITLHICYYVYKEETMANKLAPYKDPKVIASMRQFNDEYKITVQEYGMWTGEAHWPMYKHYLTWIVENNNDEDNILLDLALNKPQFDKAFRTYMRIWMSEQHITTG